MLLTVYSEDCAINYFNENTKWNCSSPWSWSMYGKHGPTENYQACNLEQSVLESQWLLFGKDQHDKILRERCPSEYKISKIFCFDDIFSE